MCQRIAGKLAAFRLRRDAAARSGDGTLTDNQDTGKSDDSQHDDAGRGDDAGKQDDDGLKSALAKERDARKAAERSLRDLQKRIDDLEGKDKSEVQRLTDERDKLKTDLGDRETRLKDLAVRNALTTVLTRAGARHPDLLVDRLARDAELDDDLAVTNADKLVQAAKKDYPDQFRVVEGKSDAGQGNQDTSNGKTDMNRFMRRQVGIAG